MVREEEKDLYAVLGVSPLATQEEIRHAYRKLVRRFHPDSGSEETSVERFQEVREAYRVLGDLAHRQAYDRRRAERGIGPTVALAWDILVSRQQLPALPDEQLLYLLVDIRPSGKTAFKRIPLNLCLVIDRSTSMDGNQLDQVKAATHQIVDQLEKEDVMGVVAFSDRATVIMPSQPLTDPLQLHSRISSIWASGGTEILQGLRAGLEQIRRYHKPDTISHLILLTDGRTYGDEEECLAEARRAGLERIEISILGIGERWNDVFLDQLARQTGSAAWYIAYPQQVRQVMRDLVQRLAMLLARDVTLTVRPTERAWVEEAFRTAPLIERLTSEGRVYHLGNLLAGKPLQVLFEIIVRESTPGFHRLLQLEMSADVPTFNQRERLIFDLEREFAPGAPEEQVSLALVNVLSWLTIFRMQEQVWKALESGQREDVRRRLETISTRLLDMGEAELAHIALLEAGRVAQGGQMSGKGQKMIRYGTRSLGFKL